MTRSVLRIGAAGATAASLLTIGACGERPFAGRPKGRFVEARFRYVGDSVCALDGNQPRKVYVDTEKYESLLIVIESKCRGGTQLKIEADVSSGSLGKLCVLGSVGLNAQESLAEGNLYHLLCPTEPNVPSKPQTFRFVTTEAAILEIEPGPDKTSPPTAQAPRDTTITTTPTPTPTP